MNKLFSAVVKLLIHTDKNPFKDNKNNNIASVLPPCQIISVMSNNEGYHLNRLRIEACLMENHTI